VIEPWKDSRNGYRMYRDDVDAWSEIGATGQYEKTGKFAEFHAGAYFGHDPSTSGGGYVSVASYLMQDGSATTATAELKSPSSLEVTDHQLDSVTHVCMTELGADGKCSNKVRYTEGDYKFSIYGAVFGDPTQWDVPTHQPTGQKMDRFAVRMSLELKGAGTSSFATMGVDVDVYFNNDRGLTLDTLGYNAVQKMTLVFTEDGTRTEVDFDFPQKYNVGPAGLESGPQGQSHDDALLPSATKDVYIVVSRNPEKEHGIFVDYIFDGSDFATLRNDGTNFGNYFLYDPTVTERKEQVPTADKPSDQSTVAPTTTIRGRPAVNIEPETMSHDEPASSSGHKAMGSAAGLLAIASAAAALL